MKEGQDKIYFVTAETFNAAKNSPHLEVFRKKGIEVLLLSDRVDEWVVRQPDRVRRQAAGVRGQGRPGSRQAGRRGREAGSREGRRRVQGTARQDEGLAWASGEGRARHLRLTDSPACLVADEHDLRNLARILKAPARSAGVQAHPRDQPQHPAVLRLKYEESTSTTGRRCCSTRRCWPKAARSTTRRLRQAHQPADDGARRADRLLRRRQRIAQALAVRITLLVLAHRAGLRVQLATRAIRGGAALVPGPLFCCAALIGSSPLRLAVGSWFGLLDDFRPFRWRLRLGDGRVGCGCRLNRRRLYGFDGWICFGESGCAGDAGRAKLCKCR
jgi:hypothetical protein